MRLFRLALASFLATAAVAAEAQTRSETNVITIPRRSFLDPGKVVPVGSESRYVTDSMQFRRPPVYYSQRSLYGQETLPGPFDLPGR